MHRFIIWHKLQSKINLSFDSSITKCGVTRQFFIAVGQGLGGALIALVLTLFFTPVFSDGSSTEQPS